MKGFLNNAKINYVMYHLNHTIELDDKLKTRFVFLKSNENLNVSKYRDKIIFIQNDKELKTTDIKKIKEIPVLFPISEKKEFYKIDENNNLVFYDDILKSSFYLLSGYQEYCSESRDGLGRFPYKSSIQHFLNISHKPIVNYYFEIIEEGIIRFCNIHSIPYTKQKKFKNFGFFLTHDIDKIDFYTKWYIAQKIKEILGFVQTKYSWKQNIMLLIRGLFQFLNFINRKNPSWDFNFLIEVERELNFKSAFYFLNKDILHKDSYYTYEERKVVNLINWLYNNGCEIGLHGTTRSAYDLNKLKEIYFKLQSVSPVDVSGIRQHRLLMSLPNTLINHEMVGLDYDTTLGFAENEGFRNSYCLPFKPYNFIEDKIVDIWEIPLNVMDVTLFEYRKLTFNQVKKSIEDIIHEINKFSGVFTLLWHNGYFDEIRYPGIKDFYKEILSLISKHEPENLLGYEIVEKMNKFEKRS
ncbi:MAG: polysaccharide deacetylase family protein [Candidatus Woesearchaeota archaeon]